MVSLVSIDRSVRYSTSTEALGVAIVSCVAIERGTVRAEIQLDL